MNRVSHVVLGLCLLPLAGCGREQPMEGPRLTFHQFAQALNSGDEKTALSLCIADPANRLWLTATARKQAAANRLHQACLKAYGKSGSRLAPGESIRRLPEDARKCPLTIDPDVAALRPSEGPSVLLRKQADGRWLIDFDTMAAGQEVARETARDCLDADACDLLTAEIGQARYPTPEAASRAIYIQLGWRAP